MTTNRFHTEHRNGQWVVLDGAMPGMIGTFSADFKAKADRLAALLNMNLRVGDVVLDSYGNPAVIVRIAHEGTRFISYEIMQTAGSDRGHITSLYADSLPQRVTDSHRVENARATVREESKRQGLKWDARGYVR